MTRPKLAETPTEGKKYSQLSDTLDMFNRDTIAGNFTPRLFSPMLALNDVQRATQGITVISRLIGNSSLEEDNEDGQVLSPGTVFGLLMAINALSSMAEYHLAILAETLEGATQ